MENTSSTCDNTTSWVSLGTTNELRERALDLGVCELKVADVPVLLVLRQHVDTHTSEESHEIFSAVGARCTHYGAPLIKGVRCGDRITCPWHGAAFNVISGDIEDAPAIKSLPVFSLKNDGKNICIGVDVNGAPVAVQRERTKTSAGKQVTVLVIGGGAAGFTAIHTLVEQGDSKTLHIVFACSENTLPYDRPKLSKNMEVQLDSILLRPMKWYEDAGVDVKLGCSITHIDSKKNIAYAGTQEIAFDATIVCTGSRAKILPLPGASLPNVHTLRNLKDAHTIAAKADKFERIVIVGSGFIGLEAASYLVRNSDDPLKVTVVSMDSLPLQNVFGDDIAKRLLDCHTNNGIEFRLDCLIRGFEGDEANGVTGVRTEHDVIGADLVIVGAGVQLNTQMLQEFELHTDGSVIVNEHMQAASRVFVAGDIARFPYAQNGLETVPTRIEHWSVAQNQGRIAARNVLYTLSGNECSKVCFSVPPFFWSVQYGQSIRYVGHASSFDRVIFIADVDNPLRFVAFYVCGVHIAAVATMGRDPIAAMCSERFRAGTMLTPAQIEENKSNVDDILRVAA